MTKTPSPQYDPRFCALAVKMAQTGSGFNEIAAKLGVTRATLFKWQKRHREFFTALTPAFKNDAWRKAIRKMQDRQTKRDLHREAPRGQT
jgi:transposase-like protein